MNRILYTLAVAILFASSALATIIRVPADQPTIQAAINAAFPGDTVLVADGTYYENIDFKGKAITVASYYLIDGDTTHVDSTIIDGSRPADPNKGSVVSFVSGEDTTSVLYGFTITGGSGTYYAPWSARAGGGIYCFNSGCQAIANKIVNNSITGPTTLGGGLAAIPFGSNAYVVLKDNQIAHNTATANSIQALGGGVILYCHAKIDSNLISSNTCISEAGNTSYLSMGGGISCISQAPYSREIIMEGNTITYNSIYNNSVPSNQLRAGGVIITGYNRRMTRNEISHNEIWNYSNLGVASVGANVGACPDSFLIESNIIRNNAYKNGTGDCYGGGLHIWGPGAAISVINNLITGNSATIGGGVVDAVNTALSGRVAFVNNTIINNAATYGGGIYFHNTTAQVMNTIIWGNQAPTSAGIYVESGAIHVAYSDVQGGWSGAGNLNSDPLFVAGSAQLSDASPCIGAGMDVHDFGGGVVISCPPHDINGDPRPFPVGSRPDIGADETDVITGIESLPARNIPKEYALSQNFPNPFNPSTTIEFALPKASFVTLKIYDLLGKEVATLVAEKLLAGNHQRVWEAKGLASGVYLYRIEVGGFVQTNKLILMR